MQETSFYFSITGCFFLVASWLLFRYIVLNLDFINELLNAIVYCLCWFFSWLFCAHRSFGTEPAADHMISSVYKMTRAVTNPSHLTDFLQISFNLPRSVLSLQPAQMINMLLRIYRSSLQSVFLSSSSLGPLPAIAFFHFQSLHPINCAYPGIGSHSGPIGGFCLWNGGRCCVTPPSFLSFNCSFSPTLVIFHSPFLSFCSHFL